MGLKRNGWLPNVPNVRRSSDHAMVELSVRQLCADDRAVPESRCKLYEMEDTGDSFRIVNPGKISCEQNNNLGCG